MDFVGMTLMKMISPFDGTTKEEFSTWVDELCHCEECPDGITQAEFQRAIRTAHHLKKILTGGFA